MKNKTKLLISILVMSFLMVGSVSATLLISEPTTNLRQAFEFGYDCYDQPGISLFDCKQVEHKVSWFEKKGFHRHTSCYLLNEGMKCDTTFWHRLPKA